MGSPSDITDNDWILIGHILEKKKSTGCYQAKYQKRDLLNAILYVNKTGCQWRYLPKDFPPWSSVYHYFRLLNRTGVFIMINAVLGFIIRAKSGRTPTPSLICIDSQSVSGDVNIDQKGIDGNKKIKGRKRHIITDVLGIILLCIVTSANTPDLTAGKKMIRKYTSYGLKTILVDQAYRSLVPPGKNVKIEIASKPPSAKGFVPVKIRWVVERTLLYRQRRLSKDYEYRVDHQESMVYIGMMKIVLNKISAI